MDNKTRKANARSQLLTAALFLVYAAVKYGIKGHLNYITIAVAIVLCIVMPAFAIRTLYQLRQQEKHSGSSDAIPEQQKD